MGWIKINYNSLALSWHIAIITTATATGGVGA
jgi:hypothetical protein